MGERTLLHEVWEDFGDEGETLPALVCAGPRGDAARSWLGPNARLVTTLRAHSHFEAMTLYFGLMGWGEYTTDQSQDYEPFPEEWIAEQERGMRR